MDPGSEWQSKQPFWLLLAPGSGSSVHTVSKKYRGAYGENQQKTRCWQGDRGDSALVWLPRKGEVKIVGKNSASGAKIPQNTEPNHVNTCNWEL